MQTDFSKISELFQKVSLNRLEWLIGNYKVDLIENIDPNLCAFDRWLCLIQLSNPEFRFVFKCHFGEDLCSFLKKKNIEPEDLHFCFDQVKELCNLIIGGIKQSLNELRVGASLPLILGGFDEVFLRSPQNHLSFFKVWSFKSDCFQIYFSMEFLSLSDDATEKLNTAIDLDATTQDGEMELL